jgi:NAD(P)-dependent dehydrogenase (short-subunit alcohol dehydrogenase family)
MITLIIGATRGLGKALADQYISLGAVVYGTARKPVTDGDSAAAIKWISGVDVGTEGAAKTIVDGYKESSPIDLLLVSAGFFGKESFEELDWKAQETMYKTSAIGPVFLVSGLVKAGLLKSGSKVIMVSSEAGSISLRHEKEGGGNYAHHASKAALNMVTRLLSIDLKDKDIAVGAVHPGFMYISPIAPKKPMRGRMMANANTGGL